MKILILVNCVNDAFVLAEGVAQIESVNFGGIRTREGAKLISKAIAITEEDMAVIHKMAEKGLELEIRQVPTDKKQMVQHLI